MDETLEKPDLSNLSFLPIRYDTKAGLIISLIIFILLNSFGHILLSVYAFFGFWNNLEEYEFAFIALLIATSTLVIYISIVKYNNPTKKYNLIPIVLLIFLNYFFTFLIWVL